MKCHQVGADILDLTGQSATTFGELDAHPVHFQLSKDQQIYQDMVQNINNYVKGSYHSVHDFLWKTGYTGYQELPPREDDPKTPADSCRFNGTLIVNKVAGNFHVTAGKNVPFFGGQHAHLTMGVGMQDYNFSHRIDHFSFGEDAAGRVNALDGDLHVTTTNLHLFQYFVQVVPTNVNTRQVKVDTFQFAVTEKNRTINHSQGSHGMPGIYIKYDLSPLRIYVNEESQPLWQFLVRLCGIVGGIFATSGMLHGLMGFLVDTACCRLQYGKYRPSRQVSRGDVQSTSTLSPLLSAHSAAPVSPASSSPLAQPLTAPAVDTTPLTPTSQQLYSMTDADLSDLPAAAATLMPQDSSVAS